MQCIKRVTAQIPKLFTQRRGMAGGNYASLKADTSMDHVFGDSTNKLNFDFQLMSSKEAFFWNYTLYPIVGFPIFLYLYQFNKLENFEAEIAAAKAAKAASE
mmetsp:Transcript_9708/g.18143  ORF Transcript_9708/g.18143 Transcript_9708/m.18143 type:complete len:102 (-) Transcript_9708:159-464(-)